MMRNTNNNIVMNNSSLDGYDSPINQYANAKIKLKPKNISINSGNINASMTTIVTIDKTGARLEDSPTINNHKDSLLFTD
jgi:hypothetical protein